MILAHPELKWKCGYSSNSSSSKYMNINDILNHPELKWDWKYVSLNLNVTMDIVLSNIDKPWNWVVLVDIQISQCQILNLIWICHGIGIVLVLILM